jgi:hypothetical protein
LAGVVWAGQSSETVIKERSKKPKINLRMIVLKTFKQIMSRIGRQLESTKADPSLRLHHKRQRLSWRPKRAPLRMTHWTLILQ